MDAGIAGVQGGMAARTTRSGDCAVPRLTGDGEQRADAPARQARAAAETLRRRSAPDRGSRLRRWERLL